MIIYLLKNKPMVVADKVNALKSDDAMCMSFITYAELLKGAERSLRKSQVIKQLKQLTLSVPVQYDIDVSICQHYAMQFTRLKEEGKLIGANDMWIACHALAVDATMVTNNEREFNRIAGLRIENWSKASVD